MLDDPLNEKEPKNKRDGSMCLFCTRKLQKHFLLECIARLKRYEKYLALHGISDHSFHINVQCINFTFNLSICRLHAILLRRIIHLGGDDGLIKMDYSSGRR